MGVHQKECSGTRTEERRNRGAQEQKDANTKERWHWRRKSEIDGQKESLEGKQKKIKEAQR